MTESKRYTVTKSRTLEVWRINYSRPNTAGPIYAVSEGMEHITFEFMLGFLLAVGLMVALWVPLFFFDYKAEKKRGAQPVGLGRKPPDGSTR